MKILPLLVLSYSLTSCFCEDEAVLHCSPKPGCQISQCDPIPSGWGGLGFNIEKHLHAKEFPITCKTTNIAKFQNPYGLLSAVSRNVLDISHIRSKLKALESTVNENKTKEYESENPGYVDLSNKFEELSGKIEDIQKLTAHQSQAINYILHTLIDHTTKMKNLKRKTAEQSSKTTDIIDENTNQLPRIRKEYKKDSNYSEEFAELRATNKMLKQQLEDQKKTLRWILRDKCISKIEHACYFTVVHSRTQVNYKTAVEICKDRGADIGVIRDNDSYTEIMNDLRFKMPRGTFYNDVWTGLGFNPFTGEITPANSFTEWINEKPYMRVLTRDYTNVFLHVNRNPAHWKQGMRNVKPNEHFYGVVCEIKL